jgi:superfamily II DNA/RNA helicase
VRGATVRRRAYTPGLDGGEESADEQSSIYGEQVDFDVDSTDDENILTTVLNKAIFSEDYALAAKASTKLKALQGLEDPREQLLDWRSLGMANWIASRAEDLGFRYPTAIQRRAALAMMNVNDIVISSQTGSGKTLAYLMPTIDGMNFVGRGMLQLLVIVPTRELVVQNAMLIWRILGGNVSRQMPGDTANIFRYIGPRGVKVKGVFDHEKHVMNPDPDTTIAEIVVGTPEELRDLKLQGDLEVDLAQFIVADEAGCVV